MASFPSPSSPAVDSELTRLYERRALVEQMIASLERYAELSGALSARRPPAAVVVLPDRVAR